MRPFHFADWCQSGRQVTVLVNTKGFHGTDIRIASGFWQSALLVTVSGLAVLAVAVLMFKVHANMREQVKGRSK